MLGPTGLASPSVVSSVDCAPLMKCYGFADFRFNSIAFFARKEICWLVGASTCLATEPFGLVPDAQVLSFSSLVVLGFGPSFAEGPFLGVGVIEYHQRKSWQLPSRLECGILGLPESTAFAAGGTSHRVSSCGGRWRRLCVSVVSCCGGVHNRHGHVQLGQMSEFDQCKY